MRSGHLAQEIFDLGYKKNDFSRRIVIVALSMNFLRVIMRAFSSRSHSVIA